MVKSIITKFATIKIYKQKSILFIDFICGGTDQDITDFYTEMHSIYNNREKKNKKFNLVIVTNNIISVTGCLKHLPKLFKFFDDKKSSKLTEKISVVVNSPLLVSTLEHFFTINPPVIKTIFLKEVEDAFKSSTITK